MNNVFVWLLFLISLISYRQMSFSYRDAELLHGLWRSVRITLSICDHDHHHVLCVSIAGTNILYVDTGYMRINALRYFIQTKNVGSFREGVASCRAVTSLIKIFTLRSMTSFWILPKWYNSTLLKCWTLLNKRYMDANLGEPKSINTEPEFGEDPPPPIY